MLNSQAHQSHTVQILIPWHKPFPSGTASPSSSLHLLKPGFCRNQKDKGRVRCVPSIIKAIATTTTEQTTIVKAVVCVKLTVGGLLSNLRLSRGLNDIADMLGKSIQLELVSAELDPKYESNATCGKRLSSIGLDNTKVNRQAYRQLLLTTPGLGEYISGAILFEKTLYQSTTDGKKFVNCLREQNIVPGIKVNKMDWLLDLPNTISKEAHTKGIKMASFPFTWRLAGAMLRSFKRFSNVVQIQANCSTNKVKISFMWQQRMEKTICYYVLKTPELEKLINERDEKGNTPLHLAAMHWRPKIVNSLTWDKRVQLELVNDAGLTALDAAEKYIGTTPPFRKAGAPRSKHQKPNRHSSRKWKPPNMENYKERINTLMLVLTIIATVTFTAGFTVPGGYKSSAPVEGTATLLNSNYFKAFLISDTIAMYNSVIAIVTLIWAHLGDLNLVLFALRLVLPLLGYLWP
ncbi:unnamed protein product [Camellia sinensis]